MSVDAEPPALDDARVRSAVRVDTHADSALGDFIEHAGARGAGKGQAWSYASNEFDTLEGAPRMRKPDAHVDNIDRACVSNLTQRIIRLCGLHLRVADEGLERRDQPADQDLDTPFIGIPTLTIERVRADTESPRTACIGVEVAFFHAGARTTAKGQRKRTAHSQSVSRNSLHGEGSMTSHSAGTSTPESADLQQQVSGQ